MSDSPEVRRLTNQLNGVIDKIQRKNERLNSYRPQFNNSGNYRPPPQWWNDLSAEIQMLERDATNLQRRISDAELRASIAPRQQPMARTQQNVARPNQPAKQQPRQVSEFDARHARQMEFANEYADTGKCPHCGRTNPSASHLQYHSS